MALAHNVNASTMSGVPAEQALATSLQNTLAVKTKHIDSLVAHVRDLRAKLNHQSQEMAAFTSVAQERENQLRHQNALLSQQALTLERAIASQEHASRDLVKRLDSCTKEHAVCRSQLEALATRKKRDDEESRNVRDALQLQLSVLRDTKTKAMSSVQQKVKALESELKQQTSKLQAVESDRASLAEHCDSLEQGITYERQQSKLLRDELQSLRQSYEGLHQGMDAMQKERAQLQHDLHEKVDTIATLRQSNEKLVSECRVAKDRCQSLEDNQLEANREAAQRLNEVSISVKRVVQECENLRSDLGATHRALAESQQREKVLTQDIDGLQSRLDHSSAECRQVKENLAATCAEMESIRVSDQSGHAENAMYQSLLKDQSELLSTVRRVAEEESARYLKIQEHLEKELKAERERTLSFSQQIAELKSTVAKYHSSRSMADLSLDSGLAASTLSLAAAATKVAQGSGSATGIISNLQQDAELLDIRLTEEMEKHVVTLRRLHAAEEESNRLRLLLAGSPTREAFSRRHNYTSPSLSACSSPANRRKQLSASGSLEMTPLSSPGQASHPSLSESVDGRPVGVKDTSTATLASRASLELTQSPQKAAEHEASLTNGLDHSSKTVDSSGMSTSNKDEAPTGSGPGHQHSHSLPTTPLGRQQSPIKAKHAWTSPARGTYYQRSSDASLLAQSLVRRALFQDHPNDGTQSKRPLVNGSGSAELAVPLTQSLSVRLENLQTKFHEQSESLRTSQAEVTSLQTELSASQQTCSGLRQKLIQAEQELVAAQKKGTRASQISTDHQQLLASQTEQLQAVKKELENLHAAQQRSNQELSDMASLNWPLLEGEALKACLVRVLEEYYSLKSTLKLSEQECERSHASLQEKIKECEQCLQQLEQLNVQHRLEMANAASENFALLKKGREDASRERQSLSDQNELLRNTVNDCNSQIQLLQTSSAEEMAKLRQQHQLATAEQQCAHQQTTDSLNAELHSLKAALEHQQQELTLAGSERTSDLARSREESLLLFEEEKLILDEKYAALNSECAAMKASMENYQQQMQCMKSALAEAEAQAESLRAEVNSETMAARQENSRLEAENGQLAADCQKYASQISELRTQVLEGQASGQKNKEAHDAKVAALQSAGDEYKRQLEWVGSELTSSHQSLVRWWAAVAGHSAWKRVSSEGDDNGLQKKSAAVLTALPADVSLKQLLQVNVSRLDHLQSIVEVLLKSWPLRLVVASHEDVTDAPGSVDSHAACRNLPTDLLGQVLAEEESSVVLAHAKLDEVTLKHQQASESCRLLSDELSQRSSSVGALQEEVHRLQQAIKQKSGGAPKAGSHEPASPGNLGEQQQQQYIEELKQRVQERDDLLNKAHEMLEAAAADRERLIQSLPAESNSLPPGQVCRYCKSKRIYRQLNYNRLRLGYCLRELRLYKQITEELQGRIFQLELHLKLANNQYQLCHEKLLQAEQLGLGDDSTVDSGSQSPEKTPVKATVRRSSSTLTIARTLNLDDDGKLPGAT